MWRPSPRRCGRLARPAAAIPRSSRRGSFPTAEEYGSLLTEGGFSIKEIALVPRPTPLKTGMDGWLRTFGRSFFDQFPEPERTKVVGEVVELLRPSLCDRQWRVDRRSHSGSASLPSAGR